MSKKVQNIILAIAAIAVLGFLFIRLTPYGGFGGFLSRLEVGGGVESGRGKITLEDYERLETGMSYDEVADILGEGEETARVAIEGAPLTISYQWMNPDGGNVLVTFQDDELASKAQAGLID
ncbi:MAG: DUF3862 domain-containing protein [Leptolyngbya sp. SIO1E4]|nr:DUF3862 domain-containing protein [Leptolyngbya sp. SIO1E4]